MNCSWDRINLGWGLGSVGSQCKEAIEIAKLLNTQCVFEFNGVTVLVDKTCNWEKVVTLTLAAVSSGHCKYLSGIGE